MAEPKRRSLDVAAAFAVRDRGRLARSVARPIAQPLIDPDDDTPDPEAPAIVEAIRRGCLTEDVMREWGLLDALDAMWTRDHPDEWPERLNKHGNVIDYGPQFGEDTDA